MTDTNSKAQVTDAIVSAALNKYQEAKFKSTGDARKVRKFAMRTALETAFALAAQEKPEPRVAIPDGWKLVPTRLTADMMAAASKGLDDTASMNAAYELALAVAPSPDLPEGEVEKSTSNHSMSDEAEWIRICTAKISNAIGGGSELFTSHGDEFRLDVDFICKRISEARERQHEAMHRAIRAERALAAEGQAK